MTERLTKEYEAAMGRYSSVCAMGGTQDERDWAWARANDALNKVTGVNQPDKNDTVEVVAIKKAA